MKLKFVEPGSKEFRELLYERLRQIILGLKSGFFTINDLFYVLNAELKLGSLSREQVSTLFKSPTLKTLSKIFGIEKPYEINGIVLESPVLIVAASREIASKLMSKYSFLTPFTSIENIEYTVTSVFKAISLLVIQGRKLKEIDCKLFIYKPEDFKGKQLNALSTLIILSRLLNITILSTRQILFYVEYANLKESMDRISALKEELYLQSNNIYTLSSYVSEEFEPAIVEFFKRNITQDEYDEFDEKLYKLIGKRERELKWDKHWYLFGSEKKEIDNSRYELAKKLGFNDKIARKIASWKVNSLNDIVKLLKDLRYEYRDEKYFEEHVISKIAIIFNQKPEVLKQILELDLL